MLFISAALGISSGVTSYYIYHYHSDHFKQMMIDNSIRAYSNLKTGVNYVTGYYQSHRALENGTPQIQIQEVKLIHPDRVVNFPIQDFANLSWKRLNPKTLVHVTFYYLNKEYCIVFSHDDDMSILTTNKQWLNDGFHCQIDQFESNMKSEDLKDIIEKYAGPLGDFYRDAGIKQCLNGFLNLDRTQSLVSIFQNKDDTKTDKSEPFFIKVIDILGECTEFHIQPIEKQE